MLTDEDEDLICLLVEERYAAMREATRLTHQAQELLEQAKAKRAEVKHITLEGIGKKFNIEGKRVFNIAFRKGANMNRR